MKEMAWNGIRFLVPDNWLAVIIEKQYLLLEDDSGPVMEIKWNRVKGSFSHNNHLKRLGASNRSGAGKTLERCDIPPEWKETVKQFDASAFFWKKDRILGKGMMLYCPLCKNAILIQFYMFDNRQLNDPYEKILASFSDHNKKNRTIYSIFDIRISIPEHFKLRTHRFESGKFELEFKSPIANIFVYRWGPASVILKDTTLAGFACSLINEPETDFSSRDDGKIIEWYKNNDINFFRRLLNRIRRGYSSQVFKMWHEERSNRILAVHMRFKKGEDKNIFNSICDSYETT